MDSYKLNDILVKSNNSINYGYVSELNILKKFINQGFQVHIPFGNSQHYDLVIKINDEFNKIQIKTSRLQKGGDISFTPYSISKGEYHMKQNRFPKTLTLYKKFGNFKIYDLRGFSNRLHEGEFQK